MKKKMGRPILKIDKKEFEKLCGLHCTKMEIADWFSCSEDTIERWCKREYTETFAAVIKKKSSKGKVSLRRMMYEKAQGGNVTMMIWLSKQHLGMKDKVEQTGIDGQSLAPKVIINIPDNGRDKSAFLPTRPLVIPTLNDGRNK